MIRLAKRILFLSSSVYPVANSGGGSIVMYRHLKRLEQEGFEIVFINTIFRQQEYKTDFKEIKILKKSWYPPLRQSTPLLTSIRSAMYLRKLESEIKIKTGDIVLGMFGDYVNLLAARISKKYKIPLFMIYHDDNLFNIYGKENLLHPRHVKKIISLTKHFFAVSEPMKELLYLQGAKSCSVLYPIPDGHKGLKKRWEDVKTDHLTFYNSGMVLKDLHQDILVKLANAAHSINGQVKLIGHLDNEFKAILNDNPGLSTIDRLATTEELFKHLIQDADALLVFYSFDKEKEHRMFTSFPSKFAEYCHLGIPVILIAPAESSIGKWAIQNNWLSYIDDISGEKITLIMQKLKQQEFWMACHEQSLITAKTMFNPELIHQDLLNELGR